MKRLLSVFFLFLVCLGGIAQPIYFDRTYDYQNEMDYSNSVVITDDGGYLISGAVTTTKHRSLYLVRTDEYGDTLWTRQYKKDSTAYWAGATSLIHTIDSNYALSGSYLKDATNNYGSDGLLVKLDTNGDTLWTKTYGGIYWDTFEDCLQNSDGSYMLAGATDKFSLGNNIDFYLVKTDSAGNLLWEKNYGGSADDRIFSFDHTPDGGYILAGYTYSFGVGQNDAYLVKVDSNGNQQWQKTHGFAQNDGGQVKTTKDGGYLFYGGNDIPSFWEGEGFIYRLDSAGNTIWNKSYGYSIQYVDYFTDAVELDDGSFVLMGMTKENIPNYDVHGWIMKVNANGDSLWSRRYKRDSDSYYYSLKETQDKGFVVAGMAWIVNGGASSWLMKLDSMGCDTPGCDVVIGEVEQSAISNENILVYPNPTTGHFTIQGATAEIQIFDLFGRLVLRTNEPQIDMSSYPAGLYVWQVGTARGKLVKE